MDHVFRIIKYLPLIVFLTSCYGWEYRETVQESVPYDKNETPDDNYTEEDDDYYATSDPDINDMGSDKNDDWDQDPDIDIPDEEEISDDTVQEGLLSGEKITSIDASIYRTCAVNDYGSIYCWGLNAGINNPEEYSGNWLTPVKQIRQDGDYWEGVLKMSMGRYHACALLDDGFIYCWGQNSKGQLGNENLTDSYTSTLVYKTGDIWGAEIVDISLGSNHSCALDKEGSVYCWGFNMFGQIGDGTISNRLTPKRILDGDLEGEKVVKLSSGDNHVCVITDQNAVYCWGQNERGQLGNGTFDNATVPTKIDDSGVLSGKNIVDISALSGHVCVLDDQGDIFCWGENNYGQLGNGKEENSAVAVAVIDKNTGDFGLIAAGWGYTCAIDVSGDLYCWGKGLGNIPEKINRGDSADFDIVEIDAGHGYACMASKGGRVFCWGENSKGELGDGTDVYKETPVRVY